VVARQWYYPYGAVRASSGALPTKRTYTGQLADETGLYFYNARYYSGLLGRFISADTIVPEPGNPQALNRYSYVYNSPLRYTDPSGHDPCGGPGVYVPDCGVDGWGAKKRPDRRDLTDWMPKGLKYMASHPAIQDIAKTHAMTLAAHVPWAGAMTWSKFQELVRDYAPFDIKRNIEREFQGGPIKLGEHWYEYSMPGNIAYGFYGAAAGYDLPLLHAGAGAAQLKDAYIDRDGPAGPWNYYGDTPDDYYAIEFGYYLYRAHYLPDRNLSRQEFAAALDNYEYRYQLAVTSSPSDYQPLTRGPYRDDVLV
jgi:RHS repeat-associated protein